MKSFWRANWESTKHDQPQDTGKEPIEFRRQSRRFALSERGVRERSVCARKHAACECVFVCVSQCAIVWKLGCVCQWETENLKEHEEF